MKSFLILILIFLTSCREKLIEQAEKFENEKRFFDAIKYYEKYLKINPDGKKAEYASYKAGIISSIELYNCHKAKHFFEFLVKNFPSSQYRKEAEFRTIFCPNYFYPKYNKLILGDSKTYGRSAKEIITFKNKTYDKITFISQIYAGKKLVNIQTKSYTIKGTKIYEESKTSSQVILQYPLEKKLKFNINGTNYLIKYPVNVNVMAGNFENCIMVIKSEPNLPASTVYYFAPEIGKILISLLYNEKETRIMELIKYE